MRKAISLIATLILSYTATAVGLVAEFAGQPWGTPVKIFGVVFGAAATLATILELIKLLGVFISTQLSSILFMSSSLAIIGWLISIGEISGWLSFGLAGGFGMVWSLLVIRLLARYAQFSVIFGELFALASGYQIRHYIGKKGLLVDEDEHIQVNLIDLRNVTLCVKELGFPAREAKTAAEYACLEYPDSPLEDKVKYALKSLNKN